MSRKNDEAHTPQMDLPGQDGSEIPLREKRAEQTADPGTGNQVRVQEEPISIDVREGDGTSLPEPQPDADSAVSSGTEDHMSGPSLNAPGSEPASASETVSEERENLPGPATPEKESRTDDSLQNSSQQDTAAADEEFLLEAEHAAERASAETASAVPSAASDGTGGTPPPADPPDTAAAADFPSPHPKDDPEEAKDGDGSMSLMDHLQELRRCLTRACIAVFLGFIACWAVVDPIFNTLVDPLLHALPKGSHAIYTTLPEGFFTRMYIAFVAGVFLASPIIFYYIWSFIAPGLYDEEKRYILPIAFLSAVFFVGGGTFCFQIVFPYAFSFFVSFATEDIVAMPRVSDYLNFVLKLLLAFGLIFEMPLFSFFLSRLGLITAAAMRRFRRYAVLVIFIVAAILTPPDVVSQLLMAGPMLILYEFSIGIAAIFGKKRKKNADASDKDTSEKDGSGDTSETDDNPYIPKENLR